MQLLLEDWAENKEQKLNPKPDVKTESLAGVLKKPRSRAVPIVFRDYLQRIVRESKFWRHINVAETINECWPWVGKLWPNGYGTVMFSGHAIGSHRLAYFFVYGDIPDGLLVLHHCDNRPCCNPFHLYAGNSKQNADDCWGRGRGVQNVFHGIEHGMAKLSDEQVIEIRQSCESHSEISIQYGIGKTQVGRIKRLEQWKHLK